MSKGLGAGFATSRVCCFRRENAGPPLGARRAPHRTPPGPPASAPLEKNHPRVHVHAAATRLPATSACAQKIHERKGKADPVTGLLPWKNSKLSLFLSEAFEGDARIFAIMHVHRHADRVQGTLETMRFGQVLGKLSSKKI